MNETLLDYLTKNNFIILPNSYKSLELNEDMTFEQEYNLYKMLLLNKAINLLGILPDDNFNSDEEIIDYLIEESIFYKETIESILYKNKKDELVKTYNFNKKIYFKYIDINSEKGNIKKIIDRYKEDY